jgi:selenocysteine lyase/cysteine desulfurase
MTHASNVTGEVLPVREICSAAKDVTDGKCVTILDMAQTFGKALSGGMTLPAANLETVDAVVFSGHKSLYAPFGASGMLVKGDMQIEPLIYGGTGFESANQQMPESVPERFEVGSMNIAALAGLHAACKWRLEQAQEISTREQENARRLVQIIESAGFEVVRGMKALTGARDGEGARAGEVLPTAVENASKSLNTGVVSVLPPSGFSVDEFGAWLNDREVQVRTGLHCAPLAHQALGTFPAGTVRFSTSYFTTDEDFKLLERMLKERI